MHWKPSTYTGWGRVLSATGELARPERAATLMALAKDSPAPAIGMRRSYGDAGLNSRGRAIDMTRLDRILSFDAKTGLVGLEAGVKIGDLARLFAPRGWLPPVMPGTGMATIGGAIANDVHGKNHHNAGSFGCHVRAITLAAGGQPRRITPEDDPALFKATVGGLGQTGPIYSAEIQLMAARGDVIMVTERRVQGFDEFLTLLDASSATYAVGWIDAQARGAALGRGILEEGETASGLMPKRAPARSVPFELPLFSSTPFVRAFNAAYWRRVPGNGHTVVKPITDFFFPIDRIHAANRLHGRAGFHQFQCVVPLGGAEVLRDMLTRVSNSGLASPLAVLKRMGPGRAGYMSFPMEGYTLAVDFGNRGGATDLIHGLERMAAEAGGRVYLAKDALVGPELIREMYPELTEFAAEVARIDPQGAFETDLTRRLRLRAAK